MMYEINFEGESVKIKTIDTNYFNITHWTTAMNVITIFGKNHDPVTLFLRRQFDFKYDDAETLYNACIQFINSATQ